MSLVQMSCRHCGFVGTKDVRSFKDEADAIEFMRGTMCNCRPPMPYPFEERQAWRRKVTQRPN